MDNLQCKLLENVSSADIINVKKKYALKRVVVLARVYAQFFIFLFLQHRYKHRRLLCQRARYSSP